MSHIAGTLSWAVKESLLEYLSGVPGAVVAGTRATEEIDAPFVFTEAPDSSPSVPKYVGRIRIEAHDGLMNIDAQDPQLAPVSHGWILTVSNPSGSILPFVRLGRMTERHEGGLWIRRSDDVALLIDAASLFDNRYAPHTRMAPVEFSVRA